MALRKGTEGSHVLFPGIVMSWENTPKRNLPAALGMAGAGYILPWTQSFLLWSAGVQCIFSQHLLVPVLL